MVTRHRQTAKSFSSLHRLVLAGVLVAGASGVGAADPAPDTPTATSESQTTRSAPGGERESGSIVSRSAARQSLESTSADAGAAKAPKADPKDLEKKYATADLNVRPRPSEKGDVLTVVSSGDSVKATGMTKGAWTEIERGAEFEWVHTEYLSDERPDTSPDSGSESGGSGGSPSDGVSGAPCPSGSSVEDGLTPEAVAVHRAVCAQFPDVDSYGGLRADSGEHGSGQAIDIMIGSDSALGDEIADYARANAGELGVTEVIWSQKIWTTQRSSEGWRPMEDRGSDTANHYDHVHVTVG